MASPERPPASSAAASAVTAEERATWASLSVFTSSSGVLPAVNGLVPIGLTRTTLVASYVDGARAA
ncbi:hypothetical protein [Streptomyces sp. URMC 129]|uniref:hypothetical protein n=1 Tax=Streptomyces sp. URMC 129 TaxID=3423407 RepID=UPI003F1B1698